MASIREQTPEPALTVTPPESVFRRGWRYLVSSQAMILLIFLILISVGISIFAPRFMQPSNLGVITRQASFVALVSLGQMCAMIAGVIDLSVGSIAGLAGIVAALVMQSGTVDPYAALLVGILTGICVGVLNGLLVTRLDLNPFLVTLSVSFIIQGAILVITGGWAIPNMPEKIQWIGKASVGAVPVPTIITLVVALFLAFWLNRTYSGRHIFAMGGNKDAALLVGIPVNRLIVIVYMISGSLSALAGVIMVARLASGQPTIGSTWLMPSFAAPILGGAAMSGGMGSVLGTLVGATIMAVIQNAIVMTGMSVYWENVVVGLVLVTAIIIDRIRRQSA